MKFLRKLSICWPHHWSRWVQYVAADGAMYQQRRCGVCHKVQEQYISSAGKVLQWKDKEAA